MRVPEFGDADYWQFRDQEQVLVEDAYVEAFGRQSKRLSLEQLRQKFGDERVNAVIYSTFGIVTHPLVRESLVWSLDSSKIPVIAEPLMKTFDQTQDDGFRWRFLNVLTLVDAPGIGQWLLDRLSDTRIDAATRAYGLYAAARQCDPKEAANLAWEYMPEWPIHASGALVLVGSLEDLTRLEATVAEYVESGKVRGEGKPKFVRTPSRLRRRLEKEAKAAAKAKKK